VKVPDRVAKLRALGNAIVPQCAVVIFRRVAEVASTGVEPWADEQEKNNA
jgi:hypothetical protein